MPDMRHLCKLQVQGSSRLASVCLLESRCTASSDRMPAVACTMLSSVLLSMTACHGKAAYLSVHVGIGFLGEAVSCSNQLGLSLGMLMGLSVQMLLLCSRLL